MGERITTASVSEDSNQHKHIRTTVKQTTADVVSIEDGREGKNPRPLGVWEIYESELPAVKRLSAVARLVYAVLCCHANDGLAPRWLLHRPPGRLAWPGVDRISNESGFSDRAVQKAIAQLLEAGVIK